MRLALLAACALLCAASHPDGGGTCLSDKECYYNGGCSATGTCECGDAWVGEHCNVLAEGQTVQLWPNPELPLPANDKVTDAWGVTVGQDAATGQWILYACVTCLFSNGQPTPFGMHGSLLISATASSLEGPYTYRAPFPGL